jgi:hypothetical protein
MLSGGTGAPNYRRQRPSQLGVDVGAMLAQRGMDMAAGPAAPMGGPMGGAMGAPVTPAPGAADEQAPEHSPSSTKVSMAEAVGRALSVSEPSEPRIRSRMNRMLLRKGGLPPREIELLEGNDHALRED